MQRNRLLKGLFAIVVTVAGFADVLYAHPKDLVPLLEPIRERYGLPAMAGSVILQGQTAALGATGVRKIGSDVKVTSNDKFHIGSCTKAMTATLIAILVERGKLKWETTLVEAFADMGDDMHPDYRDVTLKQILAHRGGFPAANQSWPKGKSFMDMHNLGGSAMEQRAAYARMILSQGPEARPGTKYIYSNAGYSIAGAMAERVMKTPWETLMKEMLFKPLGMTTAGFGAMGTAGKINQPWQHKMNDDKLIAIEPGRLSDNPPVLGPGGTVHCSIEDWAKFIAAHLNGLKSEGGLLKSETFELLHRPAFGGDYAPGWKVTKRDWAAGAALTHSGSNTMSYAVVWMAPERDFAVMAASNQGGGEVEKACDEACRLLIKEFLLKEESVKGR